MHTLCDFMDNVFMRVDVSALLKNRITVDCTSVLRAPLDKHVHSICLGVHITYYAMQLLIVLCIRYCG